jgi:putative aminopeptidase FrvX
MDKKVMNIKEKFLELTSRTYPHGTEQEIFKLLPDNLMKDEFGNLFIKIGVSDVMFTSHLDTATSSLNVVNHIMENNIIKTDGMSILGADDKAGVTIMLYMIENNIPGLYYFFIGEEVGCIGSKKVANLLKDAKEKNTKILGINKVISFDRRGYDSVITYQSSKRCCSDTFAEKLASELNMADSTFSYKKDETGVLTDSIQFVNIYSECTNISVGYKSEHTFSEQQDIEHLEKLANSCLKVNWNDLPVERDPSKTEWKKYNYYGWDDWTEDDNDQYYGRKYNSYNKTERIWFYDSEFLFISNVEIDKYSKKITKVDFSPERIIKERTEIFKFIKLLDISFDTLSWDGVKSIIQTSNKDIIITRDELDSYIPELDYTKFDKEVFTPVTEIKIAEERFGKDEIAF